MPALVGRVVAETSRRLLEESRVPSPALRAAFLNARRRSKGALAAISANTMFFNTAAGPVLTAPADRILLWGWAEQAIRDHREPPGSRRLHHRRQNHPLRSRVRRPTLAGAIVWIGGRTDPTHH